MTAPITSKPFAVITGASSGIGRALAQEFAQHGFDVLITAEKADIKQVALYLEGFGTSVAYVQADLTTYEGVEQLYAAIKATQRPVDAIALNAGIGVGGDFARQTDLQDELNIINLNVISTVHLAKRVIPDMLQQGHGRVLFTSSLTALIPGPYYAVYAASKSFVQAFSGALRSELKDTGITITALQPGPTDTEFYNRAHMEHTLAAAAPKDDPAEVARQGFEALMANQDHVIGGGLQNKVIGALSKLVPDDVKAAAQGVLTKPGSRNE